MQSRPRESDPVMAAGETAREPLRVGLRELASLQLLDRPTNCTREQRQYLTDDEVRPLGGVNNNRLRRLLKSVELAV